MPKTVKVFILAALVLLMGSWQTYAFADWLSGWSYRKQITISNTNVTADLSNYPLLVKLTNDANVGTGVSDTTYGYDIRFTDSGGTTLLPYERESFSVTSGQATANFWVKVPTITTASATTVYIYYGNSSQAGSDWTASGTPTQAQNVWDTNYKGVWHLASTSVTDSTQNGNNGTNSGATATTDKIDGSLYFDGASGWYLGLPFPAISGDWTLEMWLYQTSSAAYLTIFDVSGRSICFFINATTGNTSWSDGLLSGTLLTGSYTSGFGLTPSAWHRLVFARTGSTCYWYVDGVEKCTLSNSITFTAKTVHFGDNPSTGGSLYPGKYDEIRLSTFRRPASWIKFAYYNDSSATNELNFAAQEGGSTSLKFEGIQMEGVKVPSY